MCNPEHGAWCTVKVIKNREEEAGWEVEPHSEAKKAPLNREGDSGIGNGRKADES